MNQIRVGSQLKYQVNAPSNFLMNVCAAKNEHQHIVKEKLEVFPGYEVKECQSGPLGNRPLRLSVLPGELIIDYSATIDLHVAALDSTEVEEMSCDSLPEDVLSYFNPSRYCLSDKVLRLAADEFASLSPGYSHVAAIGNWTFDLLTYTPGSTEPTTTACDVLLQRTGVCRDYAHVAISLCGAVGIPARYVSGYAVNLQPPDFHGFFEAYFDGRWFLFDATHLAPVGDFVRIGTGRDAADVAISTIRGYEVGTELNVWAEEVLSDDGALDIDEAATAIISATS